MPENRATWRLFPGAAPLGGGAMILAWLGMALAGAIGALQND